MSLLQLRQPHASIAVNNCAILGDHDTFSKREITELSECGQLGGWNRQTVLNVTGVVVEFIPPKRRTLGLMAKLWVAWV